MQQRECLISIVVIAYRVEKYLRECLESIVSQPGEDIEILLVDDASPDQSGAICEAYAKRDSRIRVYHHEKNGGAGAARNTGIKEARGKWIAFVDGDDLLPENAVAMMRKHADSQAELLIFGMNTFFDGLSIPEFQPQFPAMTIEGKEMLQEYKEMVFDTNPPVRKAYRSIHRVSLCARLFRREFLQKNQLCFDESLLRMEDHVFTFLYAHLLKRAELIPEYTYLYRVGVGVSYRFSEDALETYTTTLRSLKEVLRKFGEEKDEKLLKILYQRYRCSMQFAIDLSIAHPQCPWNEQERMQWLKRFCQSDWVQCAAENDGKRLVSKAILRRDYKRLDFLLGLRRKKQSLKHSLRSNRMGKALHAIYRRLKARL